MSKNKPTGAPIAAINTDFDEQKDLEDNNENFHSGEVTPAWAVEGERPSGVSYNSQNSENSGALQRKHQKPKSPSPKTLGAGEPNNFIYHKIRMSVTWLYCTILMHIGQWILLLSVGHYALPPVVLAILTLLVVVVAALLLAARCLVKKSYLSDWRNVKLKAGACTPDDEKDDIPDRAVYCIAVACLLEGVSYALFTSVTAGNSSHLTREGFYTQNVLLQVLRFTSITLLGLHRVIRPANRIDPMRTMLEVS